MAKLNMDQIVEALGEMTALELNELSVAIQEKFGISAMPTMSAGPAAEATAGGSSDFDVKITAITEKMPAVKYVKGAANLGLKEASDYINDESRKSLGELMGKVFKEADAKKLVEELQANGAKAEMFSK